MKKGTHFKHLSLNDRFTIERMLNNGMAIKDIALAIGCSVRTIYNEIKRARYIHTNSDLTTEERYNPDEAERLYREKLAKKGRIPKLILDEKQRTYINGLIVELKYSPEAVLLHIKHEGIVFDQPVHNVKTIYRGIRKGYFDSVTMEDLPRRGKRRMKRKKVSVQKRASMGTSIEKRPDIDKREFFGDWEMDTVHGKNTSQRAILVLTERKTRYEIMEPLKSCTADEVRKAMNRIEKRNGAAFYKIFKSITVDNGTEFSDPAAIEKSLYRKGKRTKVYFCHPSAPHERGSNENANILIRRFFHKGSDFDKTVKLRQVKEAEFWINTYPRRIFGGACALEQYEIELRQMGLALPYG